MTKINRFSFKAPIIGALLAAASIPASAASFLYRNVVTGLAPVPAVVTPPSTPAPAPAPAGLIVLTNDVRAYDDGTYATSCNGYLTGETHPYKGATGTGVYRISVGGGTRDVYCDMTTQNGGWMLVRRLGPGDSKWFPTTDNLSGIAAYGTYSADPAAPLSNGMAFASIPYTELRLSSGDGVRWMRFAKTQLQGTRAAGCSYVATITDSTYSATPYSTNWCFRPGDASQEDPWITYQSGNANATMYGEHSWTQSWAGGTAPVGGINVFIR